MNFLAQVMATAGEAEIVDLKTRITDTERKVALLDTEVKEYLENNYAKFAILLQENHLMIKAKALLTEVESLNDRVTSQVKKELEESAEDVKTLTTKLKETEACLVIVKQLLDVDDMIKSAEEDQNNNCYLDAAKKFKDLSDLLTTDNQVQNLSVHKSLINYVTSLQEKFLSDSLLVWNSFITWDECDINDTSKKLVLSINNYDGKSDVIRVLLYYDYLDYEMKLLSKRLFRSILEPVIKCKTKLKVSSNEGVSSISLEYKKNSSKDAHPSCCEVVDKLMEIFYVLKSLDVFIDNDDTFVNKLGELFENDFCECFIQNCVYEAIPTKKEDLEAFSIVVERITEFDQFLKNEGFVKSNNNSILEYIKNVDKLFIAKICQAYLLKARKIFAKDLQNMIKIESTVRDKEANFNDSDLILCENILQRPTCCISKSVQDLMHLIREALNEIREDDNNSGVELFHTVRNIISLYCDLMPLIHSTVFKSLPQQAALFYNNCMYLAHELALLGIEYTKLFPKDVVVTLIDFIEPLRSLGQNVFNSQIENQRDQLLEILENSGVSRLAEHTEFPATIEKSLNQCFRQLNLLQTVWHDILPVNVYCKNIGMLCNCVVEKLIESVLALTDITMDMGNQLTSVFTVILDKIPTLFPDAKEVFRHVKRWSKFSELLKVLNGSLKDIDDRWADGKGPLAQEFTAEQMKHLIRALFQPTDRRSALLSRIK